MIKMAIRLSKLVMRVDSETSGAIYTGITGKRHMVKFPKGI